MNKIEYLQNIVKELGLDLKVVKSDARSGNLVALAKIGEAGSVHHKTVWMSYSAMETFLCGFKFCLILNLEKSKTPEIDKINVSLPT